MRVKIGRKIYDTEKSKEVGKQTIGNFGDSTGFEEIMFQKATQDFFLLVKGGPDSQYPEESIVPLNLTDAREWLGRVCGESYAMELIPSTEEKKPVPKTAAKTKATKKAAVKKNTSTAAKNKAITNSTAIKNKATTNSTAKAKTVEHKTKSGQTGTNKK